MKRLPFVLAFLLLFTSSIPGEPGMLYSTPQMLHRIHLPAVQAGDGGKFFAWAHRWRDVSIPLQVFGLDARQTRQYTPFLVTANVLSFAREHPGATYICGDEPDILRIPPEAYAWLYHHWSAAILAIDPSARLSPAGVAEDWPGYGHAGLHYVGYLDAFSRSYVEQFNRPPVVHEWRFHPFGRGPDDLARWQREAERGCAWAAAHGGDCVLGSFGFPYVDRDVDVTGAQLEMMRIIRADKRIVAAVWWSLDIEGATGCNHNLLDASGLTWEGRLYQAFIEGRSVDVHE